MVVLFVCAMLMHVAFEGVGCRWGEGKGFGDGNVG